MKISKTSLAVLIFATITTSTFAMEDTTMMKNDKMMMDKMSTSSMMKSELMMKEDKMKMMMSVTKMSPRSEVVKLQQHLIDEGFLKIPKWVKLGYYGPLTKAAYAKYTEKMKMMGDEMMMKN